MGAPNNTSTSMTVGVPPMVFFFTLDQLAGMLNIKEQTLRTSHLYYAGRTTGPRHPRLMYAINVAADPDNDPAEWRVAHTEFVRWLRSRGYKIAALQYAR